MYAHHPGPSQAYLPARLRAPATHTAARAVGSARGQAAAVLTLQRLAGNAAVTRLIAARQRDLVQAALRAPGRPLAEPARADMEARLGADLSGVRVHTGPAADRAARAVAAEAFTTGSRLVFSQGRYDPSSAAGRRVLAHELAHVLQQRRGQVVGTAGPLRISDPADRFEREADATARMVTSDTLARPGQPQPARQSASQPATGTPGGLPVQRQGRKRRRQGALQGAYVNYGPRRNDCGTRMEAELYQNQLGMGSSPSVRPKWWPGRSDPCGPWFSRYMVQGHLLNDNLGGPGNTMDNLTPITKSANSQHHSKVEKTVKKEVLSKGNIVEYVVDADYSFHPTGQGLTGSPKMTAVEKDIDNNFASNLAGQLNAEYTVYDQTGAELYGDRWEIINEAR